jgi:formylglycine-generating enzyme required for sulfatase activity
MRHLLLAALLVAMTGCGADTKQKDQPTAPAATGSQEDQPTTPAETVSSPETPNGSDEPSPKAGVPVVNSIGMHFVPIPAGTFTMGDGEYAHKVTLTHSFHLGQHEVTQEQYEKVMGATPSNFKGPQNPVEKVSRDDAVEFCRKLSELPEEKSGGYVYRLPTEAEWEYACSAGTTTAYSFGDSESELGDYAWYDKNSGKTTHPVGGKKPNPWGLYDMHGNVWEWCQDWHGDYPSGSVTDPTGVASGSDRVGRGGGWGNFYVECRSAHRYWSRPSRRGNHLGFRVLRSSIK